MTKQAPASKGIASKTSAMIEAVDLTAVLPYKRIPTGIVGLDRVLGHDWRTGKYGVYIPSSILLIGRGGVGKTTLLLQMAAGAKVEKLLYITTDQTIQEIQDHAERIGITKKQMKHWLFERTQDKNGTILSIQHHKPQIVVIDSLYDMSDSPFSEKGDPQANMIKCAMAFKEQAESCNLAIFMAVSTDGKEQLAGVQRTKHIVSTVLKLESDPNRGTTARLLACPDKNRFGDTSQKARFSMTDKGLVSTDDETSDRPGESAVSEKDNRKQVVIRIPLSLHEKLKRETESRQAANPGITITQSDVIRTILFDSLR